MPVTATGLTSQAGLIPVIKFLQRIGFEKTVNQTVPHQRGDNADYQLTDGIFLTLIGMIGGAVSIAKLVASGRIVSCVRLRAGPKCLLTPR